RSARSRPTCSRSADTARERRRLLAPDSGRFVAAGSPPRTGLPKLALPQCKGTPMTTSFTPAVWIHLSAALAALALGAAVFLAPKGTLLHRVSGRAWAGLMLVAAISSFWIKGNGSYSWVHLLSI